MARATPSLPVPLSPWIKTVAELSATCWTSVIICFQTELTPIMLPWPSRSSRRRWRARFCWIRERRSRAWRTTRSNWARWRGLVRKSMAPSFMARTASSTVPNAVRMITSTSGETALASFRSSRPVSPGILRSESSRSTPPWRSRSSAACPSCASTTPYPSRVSVRSRLWRTAGSSSATSSMDWSVILGPLDRQRCGERGAGSRRALPAERSAVLLLDDLARDVEAESRSLRLRREELFEELLADIRRDARARVADGDLDVVIHSSGADRELAAATQRLEAVLHEVEDGLPQQRAVDGHGRHGLVRRRLDAALLPRRHRPHELHERRHHLVDRVLVVLRPREAREGQVLLGDRVQRIDLLADGRDERRRLFHVGTAALLDEVAHQFGVELDGGDGVPHLVGDLEGELADRRHPLDHDEFGLSSLEPRERAGELGVQPLHLGTGPALAVGDHAHGECREAEQADQEDDGVPADPIGRECGRAGIKQAGHDGSREAHPGTEVIGIDREPREEKQVEEARAAAREVEQREDQQQVYGKGAAEDHPRFSRTRADADEGEDAYLVHREPEDEERQIDPVPWPERSAFPRLLVRDVQGRHP